MDGKPVYVSKGLDFATWADKQHALVQGLLLVLVVALCSLSTFVEACFGPTVAPLAMLVFGVVWYTKNAFWKKEKRV